MARQSGKSEQSTPARSRNSSGGWKILAVIFIAGILGIAWFFLRNRPIKSGPNSKPAASTTPSPEQSDEEIFSRYAGSQSCRECHPEIFDFWVRSNHGLAERGLNSELDSNAFEPERAFALGSVTSEVRMKDGSYQATTPGLSGEEETFQIERVIGRDPLRQFLVSTDTGRMQALDIAYDPHANQWFNVYGEEDRKPGEWGHWTGRGMNWNSMCASCHNTRLRKNYDIPTDSYHTDMAELSVSCEACHGPMKAHVEWRHQYAGSQEQDPTIQKPDRSQILDTCGSCHSRRTELTGDFEPGDSYFDHYMLTIPDASELYYADGQVKEEDYVFASFLGSRMHAAGVTCLDCHDPHSTRTILSGNLLCMRCHSGGYPNSPIIDPSTHTFHPLESSGAQCVNCHMPRTTYMQRHPRRDHGFTIPDPLLTEELGIPNACNRCHTEQSVEWAIQAVNQWYGDKMDRPTRERARWIAAARNNDPSAREPLTQMISGETTDFWKSAATRLLEFWAQEPQVKSALIPNLMSTNSLLRVSTVRALDSLAQQSDPEVTPAIEALLDDPVRSVRISAAWALRATVHPTSRAGRELLDFLKFNADQPTGQVQLGAYSIARGDLANALEHYQTAARWDPYSAPIHHEMAIVFSRLGRAQDALKEIQEACRLEPNEAEYQFKLGLAWNELGNREQTIKAFEKAVSLDPQFSRAWYNLGLARNEAASTEAALDALIRAESLQPNDPDIPYARATILIRNGRIEEARAAASRALEIQPAYEPARQLLRSLSGQL